MRHWRYYNPQPQCDKCGVFIPYSRATYCEKSDGMPLPSPVGYWAGICTRCDNKDAAEASVLVDVRAV